MSKESRRSIIFMKHSLKVGLCFGLTSGIITTLGLMMGLYSSTNSKLVVIGGILIIAIADSISDAMGIHISEESECKHSTKEIWESTFSTFCCKFLVASSFIIPVVLIDLQIAIYISIVWGLLLLSILSYNIGRGQKTRTWIVVLEHLILAAIVIVIAYYVGYFIKLTFG
jgi:VIT1/CCC1 family predicted Fe2+/Mn2+ transporter